MDIAPTAPPPAPRPDTAELDRRIAAHLKALRAERGWSLEALARASGVSRATLSRLENADVSATAAVLGRLCAAYGLPVSRLLLLAEEEVAPLVPRVAQAVWTDPESGFVRRSVSPPARPLAGEVLEGTLPPGARLAYERPPRPGLEHHLVLLEGRLRVTLDGKAHELRPGDCLRYRLFGPSLFEVPGEGAGGEGEGAAGEGAGAPLETAPEAGALGARYLLFLV